MLHEIRQRLVLVALGLLVVTLVCIDALRSGEHGREALWIACGFAGGGALLVLVGALRPLAHALDGLTRATQRLASGDTAARVPREPGELGQLGEAIAALADSLSRQAETMRHERDLMGGILEGMQDGVLLLDERGCIALVNPSLRRTLLLPADVVGRSTLETLRHADLQDLIRRARASTELCAGEIEVAGLKPRRLFVQVSRLVNRPDWLLLVFLDVTQLRRLEAMRREFVANVSHELRTPVSAVRSAAETLQAGAMRDAASAQLFLDIIERNGERLQQLIEDLLELSRIEAKELRLRLEPLELRPVVEHALHLLREKAGRRQQQLVVDVSATLAPALADRRAVEQVLANLVDNAIKYVQPGGRIVVLGARTEAGQVEIRVQDTGPGIEARHLPRLFERFYRVDPGRSRDMGGTGLGLSIVKHVVEAMGGSVGVDSEVGVGSTFWFRLPAAPAPAPRAPDPASERLRSISVN